MMTERLDRIEALLLATAEQQNEMNASLQQTQGILNQTAQQQAVNTDEIDTLLGAASTNEVGIRALTKNVNQLVVKIDENNQHFEILREEAIADRQRSDERFERMLLETCGVAEHVETLEQAS